MIFQTNLGTIDAAQGDADDVAAVVVRIFAGVKACSRSPTCALNFHCERVCATEHAPSNPFRLLELRHGLAEIVERRTGVSVERPPRKATSFGA